MVNSSCFEKAAGGNVVGVGIMVVVCRLNKFQKEI